LRNVVRIIFIGTVEFSREALARLVAIDAEVVGVCTLEGSSFNADYADLRPLCREHGIPFKITEEINASESLNWIRELSPDVIFCFGWSRLLKKDLLAAAPLGVVGFHPAALPANRGRHPLIWALALGLEKTASTFFFMDAGADSGDILSQQVIDIDAHDDAGSLYKKVCTTALEQIAQFVPRLSNGSFERELQNHAQANTWRKRGVADGKIDWRMSARSIHNLVRALTKPYVGAHFVIDGKDIKVWKSKVLCDVPANAEPGKVLGIHDGAPVIKCGQDALCLLATEPTFSPIEGSYL
jgi:methionyl-tRNA formyltransferase